MTSEEWIASYSSVHSRVSVPAREREGFVADEESFEDVLTKAGEQVKSWEIMNESDLAFFLGWLIRTEGWEVHFEADPETHFPSMKEKAARFKAENEEETSLNLYPDILVTKKPAKDVELIDAAIEVKWMGRGTELAHMKGEYDQQRIRSDFRRLWRLKRAGLCQLVYLSIMFDECPECLRAMTDIAGEFNAMGVGLRGSGLEFFTLPSSD